MSQRSRLFVLASRPDGRPTTDNFRLVEKELRDPAAGEVIVRNEVLSVDPYMRPRMDDRPSYIPPFQVDAPLDGGAIGVVIASADDSRPVGSVVRHQKGWRDVALVRATATEVLPDLDVPRSYFLGILGMPGLTAYAGLKDVAALAEGDILFVSGAAGAVGSLVGQFGRLMGASRVIGSAGGARKAAFVRDELGFDACLDYRAGAVGAQLRDAAPDGIDVYFDNVGGEHFASALTSLRRDGRVAMCGIISQYDSDPEARRLPGDLFQIIAQRLTIRGFISSDHAHLRDEFFERAAGWLHHGEVVYRETITEGLDQTPRAFLSMLDGGNTGKALVTV